MRPGQLAIERGSPAALDAEEGLLACCILDEKGEVFAACLEAKITPDYFFKPAHQVIYEAFKRLSDKGLPLDEIVLANELGAVPDRFEAVGGYAGIGQLVGRVETTAHFRHWLEIVREKAILRKCIAIGTTLVEKAHTGSYDPATLLEYQEGQFAALLAALKPDGDAPKTKTAAQQRKIDKLLARMDKHAFDIARRPPVEVPLAWLSGCEIAWHSNITVFIADQKSAKSSSMAAMIGSIMGLPGRDYLGFTGQNPSGKTVLHFDTEQSAGDHDALILRTLRRAGIDSPPDWFRSVHLRPFTVEERVEGVWEMAMKAHVNGGLAAIILDGAADMLNNVNDIEASNQVVSMLMKLNDLTGCAIIAAIHKNPQPKGKFANENDKGQGHLGTALGRRASMIINLAKTVEDSGREVITLSAQAARHGKPSAVRFAWDGSSKDKRDHMHRTLVESLPVPADDPKTAQTRRELAILCAEIFSAPDSLEEVKPMSYMELVAAIVRLRKVSDSTAKRQAGKLLELGIVEKLAGSQNYRPASGEKNIDSVQEF